MNFENSSTYARLVVRLGRLRSALISGFGVIAVLAFAAPAFAAGEVTLSVGTNAADAPTATRITAELNQGTQSLTGVSFVMPTSLTFNLSALAYVNPCPISDVEGADPLGDCPQSSLIGEVAVTTPLSSSPVNGSAILIDAGGSTPSIALVAINPSLSIDLRSVLGTSIHSVGGAEVILIGGNIAEEVPITAIDVNFSGSAVGYPFKVQAADRCFPSDALDATIASDTGNSYNAVSPAVNFSGCDNGGWITNGPATGDTIATDTVTFEYNYAGGGSFSKFRCTLVSLSNSGSGVVNYSDCGTAAAGSSKTYQNLTNGVYAFRVYKFPYDGSSDLRKFEVKRPDPTPSIDLSTAVANSQTEVDVATGLASDDERTLAAARLRLPTSVGIDWPSLELCPAADALGTDPLGDCPLASVYGNIELEMPVLGTVLTGSMVMYDSGGSIPDVLLVAQDAGLGIDYRTSFSINERSTAAGYLVELSNRVPLDEISPAVTKITLNGFSSSSGDKFFKVKPATQCYSSDAIDSTVVSTTGDTINSVGAAEVLTGCGNGGLITSGPATGSTGHSSTVTFDYHYTGNGSFSKFRCGLVKLSGYGAGSTVDCGNVKAGSSKTYTGLTDGVYAFRVYKSPSTLYDMRKFQVGD